MLRFALLQGFALESLQFLDRSHATIFRQLDIYLSYFVAIITAVGWFHSKWGVPKEAYLECMEAYLHGDTELGWFLCLAEGRIVGGLGVIENDFHDRKDLTPNVCAVYTEESHRCRGIAGKLLNMAVEDLRAKGISPAYLVTDHTGFYERYGWEFLCMVQGDGEPDMTRMYIHK